MKSRISTCLLALLVLVWVKGNHATNAQAPAMLDSLSLSFERSEKGVRYVYWIDESDQAIKRGDIESLVVEEVVAVSDTPRGLAVDEAGSKVYWTTAEGKIRRANLDGTEVETVTEGLCGIGSITDIVLDIEKNKIYWGNDSDCQVMLRRANLDGSEVENLLYGLFPPSSIVFDSTHQKLYWTSGAVLSATVDDTEWRWNIVVDDLEYTPGIAIDPDASMVYWTEYPGLIRRANLDGTDIVNVLTDLQTPFKLALDLQDKKIYWTERDAGKIRRSNFDGTEVEDVFTDLADPTDLVLISKKDVSTDIGSKRMLPDTYKLRQNHPNPFGLTTLITFDLHISSHVMVKVYDSIGREVATLAHGEYPAGTHSILWNASGISSGVYICKLKVENSSEYIMMVLQR